MDGLADGQISIDRLRILPGSRIFCYVTHGITNPSYFDNFMMVAIKTVDHGGKFYSIIYKLHTLNTIKTIKWGIMLALFFVQQIKIINK